MHLLEEQDQLQQYINVYAQQSHFVGGHADKIHGV
jgi:hypothetical protein